MSENIAVPINSTYHELITNDFAREWEKQKNHQYFEYRKKWIENPKKFLLENAPLHLDIEPTNACNLKCPMCPRTALLNDSEKSVQFTIGKMDISTFQKIIDEAVEIGVYSIKLNWLGEPLVHPDIVEMVRYSKQKGIIDVMFNTNAVLLKESLSEKLILAGLDKIFFSFDSPKKEKYEQIRVGANYEETIKNIRTFISLRNKLGTNSPLTKIQMVLMESNQDEFEDFVDLFKNIVDIVAYNEYRPPVGKGQNKLCKKFGCCQLWQRMFINWNGECTVCCIDSEKEYLVGNIHQNSIQEIWKNEKYQEIREQHKFGNWDKVDMCKKCAMPYKEKDGSV